MLPIEQAASVPLVAAAPQSKEIQADEDDGDFTDIALKYNPSANNEDPADAIDQDGDDPNYICPCADAARFKVSKN